jgi:D-serine dehydratase
MRLDELLRMPVDPTVKGWPARAGTLPLGEVGARGWSLLSEDLPLPAAIIRRRALEHNSRWMRSFLERSGALICPHGKTTMAPQLFARQLADGAFGITVATAQQLMVARRFGVARVLMANQLIGRQAIRTVLTELADDPGFEFLCLIDSVRGVERLAEEAFAFRLDRPLQVLLEVGAPGGRTGARSLGQALEVARAAAAAPELALVGVEAFEGLIREATPEASARKVEELLDFVVETALACAGDNLFAPGPVLLSAGGSAFFDRVAQRFRAANLDREVKIVLRSGCYLTHDSKMYRKLFAELCERTPEARDIGPGLRPALEVWAYVQSVPEPGLAIATIGRRDVSYDVDLPVPEQWFRPGLHERPQVMGEGFQVTKLNDQHAYVTMPADGPLEVGDMVSFGISHPCTTFDKWQLLYVVDDDYRVVEAIRTFF